MTRPAFYTEDRGRFVPTRLGVSPWNPRAQLGVGLAGLIVQQMEAAPGEAPMFVTRLMIDILGAVPIEPLTFRARVIREGRRMRMLEGELLVGERVYVRATALCLRIATSPDLSTPPTRAFPEGKRAVNAGGWFDTIRLEGGYEAVGPGASWVRITADVVQDRPTSSLAAVAMISDLGSGTAPLVTIDQWTYANVDISAHLIRPPRGEWFLIDAMSESAGNGAGIIHSRLGDRDGMIGMAHQTVFLEPLIK